VRRKSAAGRAADAHNVPLIEDDVYSELYFGREKPLPAKAWDQDMTLHCSSFSKCLVAGFRIGWVAAGKHARRIQQLQLMSTLSTSSPMQLALVDYLATKRYDAHLRRLRRRWPSVNSRPGSRCCAICPLASKSTITTAATFYGWNCRRSWMRGC
jgi:DNA-binding transcriptional MocR family regulator